MQYLPFVIRAKAPWTWYRPMMWGVCNVPRGRRGCARFVPVGRILAAAVVLNVYGKRFPNTIIFQEASKLYQVPIW